MTRYYKLLAADGTACNGGTGRWHLPTNGKPGRWMPKRKPKLCASGYHLVTIEHVLEWSGDTMFEAEWRGEHRASTDKIVVEQARLLRRIEGWNPCNLRLYAADCAERALPHFERLRPNDDRPHRAIEAARAYARDEIYDGALSAAREAAQEAAWATARETADAAAMAAARAAAMASADAAGRVSARAAAEAAMEAAVRAAVRAAARAAAEEAARAAERRWQLARLCEYLGVEP